MTVKKTANKGFDLSDLKPTTEEIKIELKHPLTMEPFTKPDGSSMSVTVYAPFSTGYKKALHEVANERIKLQSKAAEAGKKLELMAEDVEENSISFLTKVTKDFDLVLEGKAVEFSKDFVKKLYTEFVGIKEQVEAEIDNTENFMKH